MLAAGVTAGAELRKALRRGEPLTLFSPGVRKALKPVPVVPDLCSLVVALESDELDETRGITAADAMTNELTARTNKTLSGRFVLAKEKADCNSLTRRCMMSPPMIWVGAASANRNKLRFEVVLKGMPANTLTLYFGDLEEFLR